MLGIFFQLFNEIIAPSSIWYVWPTTILGNWKIEGVKFDLFSACAAPFPNSYRIKSFRCYIFPFLSFPLSICWCLFSISKCNVFRCWFACLFVCLLACCHAGSQRFSLKHCDHSENSYIAHRFFTQYTICFEHKLFSVFPSSNTSSFDGSISSHPYINSFKIGKYEEEEE